MSVLTFNVILRVLPVKEGPLLEFTETSVSFIVPCVSKQNQLGNQNFFFPPSALCYSGNPLLAVVPESFWKEDCGLRRLLGKAHTTSNSNEACKIYRP